MLKMRKVYIFEVIWKKPKIFAKDSYNNVENDSEEHNSK